MVRTPPNHLHSISLFPLQNRNKAVKYQASSFITGIWNCCFLLNKYLYRLPLCLSINIKLLTLKGNGQPDPGHCFKNAKAEFSFT